MGLRYAFAIVAIAAACVYAKVTLPDPCEPCVVNTALCTLTTAHSMDHAQELLDCALKHNITRDCGVCIKDAYGELPDICKSCVSSATACFRTCETDLKCIKSCEADAGAKCHECRATIIPQHRSNILTTFAATGACTTGTDFTQVSNQKQCKSAFEECTQDCVGEPTCVENCMENTYELSSMCSSCFAAASKCGLAHCAVHCIPSTKTASCYSCTLEHCGDDLERCTGIPIERDPTMTDVAEPEAFISHPTVGGGMCTSSPDVDKVNDPTIISAIQTCGMKCLGEPSCVDNCMETYGLSSGCATCFGSAAQCAVAQCTTQCIPSPSNSECTSCLMNQCGSALETCTGISIHPGLVSEKIASAFAIEPVRAGACSSDIDIEQVKNQDQCKNAFEGCAQDCIGQESCVEDCMEKLYYLSPTCATCFGEASRCSLAHCSMHCIPSTAASSCYQCTLQNCGNALEDCTGIPIAPSLSFETPVVEITSTLSDSGACTADIDAEQVNNQEQCKSAFQSCAQDCVGKESCVDECMENMYHLSPTCAGCFGQASHCSLTHCALHCIPSTSTADCYQCTLDHCGNALQQCTGIPINVM